MTMPQSNLVTTHSVDRETFESLYAGPAPWDIGRPQACFTAIARRVKSPILDAGCGTGEHALYFAARGHGVTGIDFLEEPIRRARRKAVERGLMVDFVVKDATTLEDWGEQFATVIDSGLFHGFSDEDRRRYVAGLAQVLEAGGRLYLMCFSDEEPGTAGPRRVSRQDLYDAFADGWEIESIQPAQFEVNPEFTEITFSEGGPKAWFAVIRKVETGDGSIQGARQSESVHPAEGGAAKRPSSDGSMLQKGLASLRRRRWRPSKRPIPTPAASSDSSPSVPGRKRHPVRNRWIGRHRAMPLVWPVALLGTVGLSCWLALGESVSVLPGAVAVVLTASLGMVRLSRARATRRFHAVLDSYAEREIERERRWKRRPATWRGDESFSPRAAVSGGRQLVRRKGEQRYTSATTEALSPVCCWAL